MAFMEANMLMHVGMGIDISCDHTADFVRAMLPHHAGAIRMCDILTEFRDPQDFDTGLDELCLNITRTQRAEIAWMSQWLDSRGHAIDAFCIEACDDGTCPSSPPELPCENILPTSSFCHLLGNSYSWEYCTCEGLTEQFACGTENLIDGFGLLDVSAECSRHCGLCPAERPPLFHDACPSDAEAGHGDEHGDGHGDHRLLAVTGACQFMKNYPVFCTKSAADAQSGNGESHQDMANGPWMVNQGDMWHGDYEGDAPECNCCNLNLGDLDGGNDNGGHGDHDHDHGEDTSASGTQQPSLLLFAAGLLPLARNLAT